MRENSPGCALAGVLALLLGAAAGDAWAQGDAKRGQYLAKAGGCLACHTEEKKDAVPFAGGRALKTPFGTFYGPAADPRLRMRRDVGTVERFHPRDARGRPARRQKLLPGI